MSLWALIEVSFDWVGTHYWPNASDRHIYLRHPHRHKFHGKARIEVKHDDRELEFFAVQDYITEQLLPAYKHLGPLSCEWVARDLLGHLTNKYGAERRYEVSISEDGENGAIVGWTAD